MRTSCDTNTSWEHEYVTAVWGSHGDMGKWGRATKWELLGDRDLEVCRWGHHGQAGCSSGQPGLEIGDPAHSRVIETR